MADLCTISGTILMADGTPHTEAVVKAVVEEATDQGGQIASGVGVTSDPIEVFTEDNGTFEISLIQGARVLLHIPAINLRKLVIVPTAATANLVDLI